MLSENLYPYVCKATLRSNLICVEPNPECFPELREVLSSAVPDPEDYSATAHYNMLWNIALYLFRTKVYKPGKRPKLLVNSEGCVVCSEPFNPSEIFLVIERLREPLSFQPNGTDTWLLQLGEVMIEHPNLIAGFIVTCLLYRKVL